VNAADFRYFHPLRVRYAEVDAQGIVFNAHYLTYFDTALTEYLRDIGYDAGAVIRDRGLDFHLVKATVEYHAPIRSDALVRIGVAAQRIGNSSITWKLGIFPHDNEELLSSGEIIWVCSRNGEHRSHPLPAELLALLTNSQA
jgi:acyl-CoA thioester hydrolase